VVDGVTGIDVLVHSYRTQIVEPQLKPRQRRPLAALGAAVVDVYPLKRSELTGVIRGFIGVAHVE